MNDDELKTNFEKIHETLELILDNQKKILQGKKTTTLSNKNLNKYESWFQQEIQQKYDEISTAKLFEKLGVAFPSLGHGVKKRIIKGFLKNGFIKNNDDPDCLSFFIVK